MTWVAVVSGLVALVVIGWLAWRIVRIRMVTAQMAEVLRAEGDTGRLPRRRQGTPLPIRDAADVRFTFVMRDVERAPGDWRSWYRLSRAYAESGDRKRARKAMRRAMGLFRRGGDGAPIAPGTSA